MLSFIRSLIVPILSLFIMILGNNFILTIVPLRMKLEGYSTDIAGYLTAAYFAGLMIGSIQINRFIEGVGHIRAFSAFASLFTLLTMLQGVFVNPAFWMILRFVCGLCMAGIFITIESWLLVKSSVHMRGKALSVYMITNFAGQAIGQLFLNMTDPGSIYPFCLVVVLASLAVIPLSLTRTKAPIIEEPSILSPLKLLKISPLGAVGAFFGGCILGPIFGLLPVYAQNLDFTNSQIAIIMGITISGGLVVQWPIGLISDRIDRRKVLFTLSILTLACSLVLGFNNNVSYETFLGLCFLFGGFCFAIYPLAVSHSCDLIDPKDLVPATGGMLLFYGTGAVIGPILASYPMKHIGNPGFFYFVAFIALLLSLFTLSRIISKTPTPKEHKLPFSNMPRTTPMASELDPRIESQEEKEKSNH